MPRMVVLWHEISPDDNFDRNSHFDFMLEADGGLWTWALERWPIEISESVTAKRLADHRIAYLDYEGPISGGRGTVCRVDAGEYRMLGSTAERLEFELASKRCAGCFVIERGNLTKIVRQSKP